MTDKIDGSDTCNESKMEPQPHIQTPGELLPYLMLLFMFHQ